MYSPGGSYDQTGNIGQKRRRSTSPAMDDTSPTTSQWPSTGVVDPMLTPAQGQFVTPSGSSNRAGEIGGTLGSDQTRSLEVTGTGSLLQQQTTSQQPVKKRGTACEACRTKKSRCDSVRPVCGSCAKARIECKYPSDSTLSIYETTSIRILDGINRIERLLAERGLVSSESRTISSPSLSNVTPSSERRDPSFSTDTTPIQYMGMQNLDAEVMQMTWQRSFLLSKPKGDFEVILESALNWPIFIQKPDGSDLLPQCPYIDRKLLNIRAQRPVAQVEGLPVMTADAIKLLTQKFVRNVYLKYPIVDLDELQLAARTLLENGGPGWGLSACLICLACALGAVSEEYGKFVHTSRQELPSMRLEAWRWWTLAQRRLAIATAENSILAVQCQTLAGFWFMYNFDPLAAVKTFNAACLSWQSIHLEAESMSESRVMTEGYKEYRKQRLFWTAMKAESELRSELCLPLSDAARLEFPREIPTPPSHEFRILHVTLGEPEEKRAWFYYVGEIFIRRCQNRITNEITQLHASTSGPATINLLVQTAKEFEVTLMEWRQNLPPPITFPDPLITELDGVTKLPLKDELQSLLRARYIECFECLYRPFTEMAILNNGECDEVVTMMASKGLAYCVVRMKSDLLRYRNPLIWNECRATLLCAIIVIAAVHTQKYIVMDNPDVFELREGWEEALETLEKNLSRWKSVNTEIEKYVETLQWARRWVST